MPRPRDEALAVSPSKRPTESVVKRGVRAFFRRVVSLYFRAVDVGGDVPTPNIGGRIFCGNHHNGLVDPLLVITAIGCPVSPIAKSTLWKIPGLRALLEIAEAVPVARKQDTSDGKIDNDAMFDAVGKHLVHGGNMLIFPEGISHNDPHIAKLKTGAARMLVRANAIALAEQRTREAELSYQAVAVDFDARDVFRSRAFLLFGPPRFLRDHREVGDALVPAITAQIKADLDALYLDAPTWEERRLLLQVAELYADSQASAEVPLGTLMPLAKQVAAARDALAALDGPRTDRLRAAVAAYREALDALHVRDADVRRGASGASVDLFRRLGHFLLAPFALVASVLYLIPYPLPRLIARWTKGTDDVKSTYKLGVGLLVFPLWAIVLTGIATRLFEGALLPIAIAVIGGSPFAALRWIDRADAHGGGLVPLVTPEEMATLRRQREDLLAALEEARTTALAPTGPTSPDGAPA
jgi:1-acyl-sn-glycerol-3-phosphate acyltransferase